MLLIDEITEIGKRKNNPMIQNSNCIVTFALTFIYYKFFQLFCDVELYIKYLTFLLLLKCVSVFVY